MDVPDQLRHFIQLHLTGDEWQQIDEQFSASIQLNRQVLWTGMPREVAQKWADAHNMQTLTTAMGPLMAEDHHLCQKRKKTKCQWTRYIQGASAIFALHISKGDVVTVLTQPPPSRFHPSGMTNFQVIEEPIIKGKLGNPTVRMIQAAHPTVQGASETLYRLWPDDQSATWISAFGNLRTRTKWRKVKSRRENLTQLFSNFTTGSGGVLDRDPEPIAAIQRVQESHTKDVNATRDKQKSDAKVIRSLYTAKRESLRNYQRSEIRNLHKKQANTRSALCKQQRGARLHNHEVQEMRQLQDKLKRQRAELLKEETSKLNALKRRYASDDTKDHKRGNKETRQPVRCCGRPGKPEAQHIDEKMSQTAVEMAPTQANVLQSFLSSTLAQFLGWFGKE